LEKSEKISFADFPITYGFYLLVCSVGEGGFCNSIRRVLKQTGRQEKIKF